MVEFAGVVDALHCSTEIEAAVAITGGSLAPDRRIGINVGDVVVEGADIFGDGINVASRLEDLAEPGGVCVSARVQEDAAGRLGGKWWARLAVPDRATLLRALQEFPGWVPNYRFLAARGARIGRLDEAREIVQRLRALTPLVVPSAMQWRNPEQREPNLAGLRLATGEVT